MTDDRRSTWPQTLLVCAVVLIGCAGVAAVVISARNPPPAPALVEAFDKADAEYQAKLAEYRKIASESSIAFASRPPDWSPPAWQAKVEGDVAAARARAGLYQSRRNDAARQVGRAPAFSESLD